MVSSRWWLAPPAGCRRSIPSSRAGLFGLDEIAVHLGLCSSRELVVELTMFSGIARSQPGFPVESPCGTMALLPQAVAAGQRVGIRASLNTLISIIPFAENARVDINGVRYTLHDEPLRHATHGLSNIAVEEECSVMVSQGSYLSV